MKRDGEKIAGKPERWVGRAMDRPELNRKTPCFPAIGASPFAMY